MKEYICKFPTSNRVKCLVISNGKVYFLDGKTGKLKEAFYHISHGYKRVRLTDVSALEWGNQSMNTKHAYKSGLIVDRDGWIAHSYEDRISHANTES